MSAIRAVFRRGILEPVDPLNLPDETPVIVTITEDDDLPSSGIAQTAGAGGAFDFLADRREDIYSPQDGEAI